MFFGWQSFDEFMHTTIIWFKTLLKWEINAVVYNEAGLRIKDFCWLTMSFIKSVSCTFSECLLLGAWWWTECTGGDYGPGEGWGWPGPRTVLILCHEDRTCSQWNQANDKVHYSLTKGSHLQATDSNICSLYFRVCRHRKIGINIYNRNGILINPTVNFVEVNCDQKNVHHLGFDIFARWA